MEADSAIKLGIDADLSAETTDVIEISSANAGASVILNEINAMNEMQAGKDSFTTAFLTGAGAASVNTSMDSALSTVYGQTYVYDVDLNGTELTFTRGEKISGLPGAVADSGDRTFVMSSDEIVTDWKAATKNDMQGSKLVIQGNENSVIGENNEISRKSPPIFSFFTDPDPAGSVKR